MVGCSSLEKGILPAIRLQPWPGVEEKAGPKMVGQKWGLRKWRNRVDWYAGRREDSSPDLEAGTGVGGRHFEHYCTYPRTWRTCLQYENLLGWWLGTRTYWLTTRGMLEGGGGVSAEASVSFCQQRLANLGREVTTKEMILMLHMLKPHSKLMQRVAASFFSLFHRGLCFLPRSHSPFICSFNTCQSPVLCLALRGHWRHNNEYV